MLDKVDSQLERRGRKHTLEYRYHCREIEREVKAYNENCIQTLGVSLLFAIAALY